MANRNLFQTDVKQRACVRNEAGGRAYQLSHKQQLAQYAATGCLSGTFYTSADNQLATVLGLCEGLPAEFLAKVAIYSRERGFMKDMPALLCAILAVRGPELLPATFARVIDNGRMLRNFVQILRSGAVGRRSLGTMPRRLVRQWLASRPDAVLVAASVGRQPSLADVVRMVHPKPADAKRSALYAWLCGRQVEIAELPQPLRCFENFKRGKRAEVPDVPFQMLTALDLTPKHWRNIASRAPWQTTRMNLNTFLRHGVFDDQAMVAKVASRLRDPQAIRRAKVFPYQLMTAYMHTSEALPFEIREALQDAMEIATSNVPCLPGKVYVCVDVSGSMHSSVTGSRQGASSKVRCVDVAALFAAAILRSNPSADVIPFAEKVRPLVLNRRDSVMSNAEKLAALPWGGTDCSAPLRKLVHQRAKADLVIMLSDNESWIRPGHSGSTELMKYWKKFQRLNDKSARLVCLDIQPYATVQAPAGADVLHVGGFSDQVFEVIRSFMQAGRHADHWVRVIEDCA